MREIELKAVVPDEDTARAHLEAAGAHLEFVGRLEDRRYDDAAGRLMARDHVLRLRLYRNHEGQLESRSQDQSQTQSGQGPRESDSVRAYLDWKGPTEFADGYKVREEASTPVAAPDCLAVILERLGFTVIREIDREIAQYVLGEAIVRFERYPLMDVLVEVEGPSAAIERAIEAMGLSRSAFSAARLPEFVARFEARTGTRAALSDGERGRDGEENCG